MQNDENDKFTYDSRDSKEMKNKSVNWDFKKKSVYWLYCQKIEI